MPFVLGDRRRRRPTGRRRGVPLPGPGDRRVQRAGRPRRAVRHHQRLRRHRPGLRRRPGDRADRRGHHAGRASPRTSRRWRPAGAGRRLGRRHRRQRRATRAVDQRDPGARRPRRTATVPGETYELVYPDGAARRRDAARPTRGPAGCSWPARTSSAARCTPRPTQLRADGPNRLRAARRRAADRHRRRVLPRRPAPRAARLRPGGRLHAIPASRRSASSTCPTQQQGEAIAVDDDGAGLRHLRRGQRSRCSRCRCRRAPGRGASGAGPSAVAVRPRSRPAPARARSCPRRSRASREPWQWLLGTALVGRCGRRAACGAIRPRASHPSGCSTATLRSLRLGSVPRLRRTSPDEPGWTRRRAGQGFVYLDQYGERLADADGAAGRATW